MAEFTITTYTQTDANIGTETQRLYVNYSVSTSNTSTVISGTVYASLTINFAPGKDTYSTAVRNVSLSVAGTTLISNASATLTLTAAGTRTVSLGSFSKTINRTNSRQTATISASGTLVFHYFMDTTLDPDRTQTGSNSASATIPARPSCSYAVSSSAPYYSTYIPYSVNISNVNKDASVSVSSIVLKLGSATVSRTNAGSLSITPTAIGNYTPTITITDSGGSYQSYNLPQITINSYVLPTINFNVERTTSAGVAYDEGKTALVTASFTYTSDVAELAAPSVVIKNDNGVTQSATITWYSDDALTTAISDWGTVSSSTPVYALIYNSGYTLFDTEMSYTVSITPIDLDIKSHNNSGTTIMRTLASTFYTVNFLAGGKGIAFGQASTHEGFYCNMDAHFKDKQNTMRALFDFFYPVGSYYETSVAPSTFNPNNVWGGTWVLETAGLVHVSGASSGTYQVSDTYTAGAGTQQAGNKDAIIPYHNHSFTDPTYGAKNGAVPGGGGVTTNTVSKTLTGTFNDANAHNFSASGICAVSAGGTNAYTGNSANSRTSCTVTINAVHTHTIPEHSHTFTNPTIYVTKSGSVGYKGTDGNATNANMQPYISVFRWHRTV